MMAVIGAGKADSLISWYHTQSCGKKRNKRGTDQTNLTKCRWEWKRYNFPWKSVTWLLEASQPSEPSSADTVLSETIYQPTSTLYFQGVQFPWERSLRGFSLTEVGVVSSKVDGGNDGSIHKQMKMSRLIYSLLFNGHCVCVSVSEPGGAVG